MSMLFASFGIDVPVPLKLSMLQLITQFIVIILFDPGIEGHPVGWGGGGGGGTTWGLIKFREIRNT